MRGYWQIKKEEVEMVAHDLGLKIELKEHDDPFVYDLYDCGSYEPSIEEIGKAIIETFGGGN